MDAAEGAGGLVVEAVELGEVPGQRRERPGAEQRPQQLCCWGQAGQRADEHACRRGGTAAHARYYSTLLTTVDRG